MALNITDFRTRFPEFDELGSGYVQAKLDEATTLVDDDYWGDIAELAQGYYAAHLIALSPFGGPAKLSQPDGSTSYLRHLDHLRNMLPKRGIVCAEGF